MARFSVGGEADEGCSSQVRKKPRIEHEPLSPLHEPEEELHDEESSEEEEDESGEDEEEIEEGEERDEDEVEEEEEEDEESIAVTNQTASSVPRSSIPPAPTGSTGNARIFLTLTDPEVLDCPICYESLTIPVYQAFSTCMAI